MRNISFSLTTPQFLARTKTVTRRLNWLDVKVGENLMGCEKCMGRKPGEPLVRLGPIEVTAKRREKLNLITQADVIAEGFPNHTPASFVRFFCASHPKCRPSTVITRIQYRYLPVKKTGKPTMRLINQFSGHLATSAAKVDRSLPTKRPGTSMTSCCGVDRIIPNIMPPPGAVMGTIGFDRTNLIGSLFL